MAKPTRMLALAIATTLATALSSACGSSPTPPINPQDRIKSTSPDELPPTGTSGLGTPGGQQDAGLPSVPMDGSAPR